jgi:hypothetical protein
VDWSLVATLGAPILAAAAAVWVDRLLRDRPRLLTFYWGGGAIRLPPSAGGTGLQVHHHAVVIKNAGRKAATNVRLGHLILPNFDVYPQVDHRVADNKEIVFPTLVPGEQVVIHYIYAPPVTWNTVNSYCKSDEGLAKVLSVVPTPVHSKLVLGIMRALMLVGIVALAYLAARALLMLI